MVQKPKFSIVAQIKLLAEIVYNLARVIIFKHLYLFYVLAIQFNLQNTDGLFNRGKLWKILVCWIDLPKLQVVTNRPRLFFSGLRNLSLLRQKLHILDRLNTILPRLSLFRIYKWFFRDCCRRLVHLFGQFSQAPRFADLHPWRVRPLLKCGGQLCLSRWPCSLQWIFRLIPSSDSQIGLEGAFFILFFIFSLLRIFVLARNVLVVICLLN